MLRKIVTIDQDKCDGCGQYDMARHRLSAVTGHLFLQLVIFESLK